MNNRRKKFLATQFVSVMVAISAVISPVIAGTSVSLTDTPVVRTQETKRQGTKKSKKKTAVSVASTSKVKDRKKAAKKYAGRKATVASAMKGEKLDTSIKKKLKKLKKLSLRMSRLYIKKGKAKKSVKVTVKVNNLTKKVKHVYVLRYDTKKKKWYLTKAIPNYKKKTVTFSVSNFSTYAVVYTK